MERKTGMAGYPYWVWLPDNLGEQRRILLFLHGSGERGAGKTEADLQKLLTHGPPKLIAAGLELPYIVVAPQCPDKSVWDPKLLIKVLKDACTRFNADTKRVLVSGLSMGGFGAL